MTRRSKFVDKSRLKIGKQALPYRAGLMLRKFPIDWIDFHLPDDVLRKLLKS
jgi:hypothetical protein